MRVRALSLVLMGLLVASMGAAEDNEPEMPGDGLDLYAVLDTFAESESVEDFENRLNDPDAELVNLDLNADDEVDYVTVVEEADGTAHVFFLRVPVSEEESQDVAHIAVDKQGEDVTAQVIGEEALYGPDFVVEPETSETGGRRRPHTVQLASSDGSLAGMIDAQWPRSELAATPYDLAAVIVVSSWRVVRVIYAPGYTVWRSPYRWHRYPSHWRVRRPVARSHYRNRHAHHARKGYRRTTVRRSNHASNVHQANRVSSPSVSQRSGASSVSNRPATAGTAASSPAATASPRSAPATTPNNPARSSTTSPSPSNTRATEHRSSPSGPSRSNTPRRNSPGGPRRR